MKDASTKFHYEHHCRLGFRRRDAQPPKGWISVWVGEEAGEQQRFFVPIRYLTHPLFVSLLKDAEEEYGFEQKGVIAIPCNVEHFQRVKDIIDGNNGCNEAASGSHHHRAVPLHISCFRALS
ncbi:hypothetical protein HPP92_025179 [Vanilla planifolia]|uniref:Small auxin up regulated protein n=1 Tax=Vanilla planifolia TaxID=51239 RepID=A0A835PHD9_VANPL|nr:hypothetical protein HPP92_025179 [Vanilla planifolia]